jgi:pimeloyl-ACP methyl ester carboxylesterase
MADRQTLWAGTRPWQKRPDPTEPDGPDPYGDSEPEWLKIDWRRHLRRVEVDTSGFEAHEGSEADPAVTDVSYVEIGEGPPLVFVHGLGGCWENWLENLPHFAQSHRVIALDLPGFGDSPMPGWEISISAYGSLVNSFCQALETGPVPLVGNSMGGFISAEVAVSEPTSVQKLVLVSAAGVSHARMRREPAEMVGRMARAAAPLALRGQERALRRPRLRKRMVRQLFFRPAELPREFIWETVQGGMHAPGLVAAIRGLAGYDFLDRLEDVEIPTLVVWGRNDLIVPASDGEEFAERIGGAQLEIFDHCGHLPMAEHPVRFNRLLESFLAEGD